MVRAHYRRPPPLLPSRREHARCRRVLKTLDPAQYEAELDESLPKHKICMNLECPKYTGEGQCPLDDHAGLRDAREFADEDLKAITKDRSSDSSLSDSDFEYLTASVKRRKLPSEDKSPKRRPGKLALRCDDADSLLEAVDEQLGKLDERLVKLLAWQRLQQVLRGEQIAGLGRGAPLSAAAEAAVRRSVDRARLARFGFRHVALPSELLSREDREHISSVLGVRRVWGAGQPRLAARDPHALADRTVRATLCAVERPARNGLGDGLGRPVPMRLSRLVVGTDSGCDVVLDAARCRHVSPRHAVIFSDEVTGHFELINYSEWGTLVNGVMFACDVSEGGPAEGDEAGGAARAPGDIDIAPVSGGSCRCPASRAVAAWEGSALVPHSALLHFGCLMYVFTITDRPADTIEDA